MEGGDFWLNELNKIPDAKTDMNVQKFRPSQEVDSESNNYRLAKKVHGVSKSEYSFLCMQGNVSSKK